MNGAYVHPATRRRLELIDEGYVVIDQDVTLDKMRKGANSREYPPGSVWITTGHVMRPTREKVKRRIKNER